MRWELQYPRSADRGGDEVEHRGAREGFARPSVGVDAKCDNCKMPIERDAFVKGGRTFCCDGCAYGGPCVC